MPLELADAEVEDFARFVDLEYLAFVSNPTGTILFPGGGDPAAKDDYRERLLNERKDDPSVRFVKVIETERGGEIVAFAKWHLYLNERPESEWNVPNPPEFGAGSNPEACAIFFGRICEGRVRIMQGRPHCLLAILDTDPKDQRRGAGGMLVQWGTDIADKEGIPAYLESSAEGYSLYNKHGFKDIESWDFDLEPWGKSGSSRIVWMLRPPKQP